jgi:hypothetical protein
MTSGEGLKKLWQINPIIHPPQILHITNHEPEGKFTPIEDLCKMAEIPYRVTGGCPRLFCCTILAEGI